MCACVCVGGGGVAPSTKQINLDFLDRPMLPVYRKTPVYGEILVLYRYGFLYQYAVLIMEEEGEDDGISGCAHTSRFCESLPIASCAWPALSYISFFSFCHLQLGLQFFPYLWAIFYFENKYTKTQVSCCLCC